ncbi:hypothetical protein RJ44_15130 [Alteromonas macleodii]|uniref:prolipoprotein diacylglyceryl transferase n=1 Tax=Alteromonas macleodii TaxID=28108 RepID=UPI00057CCABF|nr:prolipoprotein diacylglyceryl transferase family protein [Alteromonas macleodii]KHT57750.1 hypothetical protein RJ44_15130 [Alteromonas macleodii]
MIPYFSSFSIDINFFGITQFTIHAFGIFAMSAFFASVFASEKKASQLTLSKNYMFELYIILVLGIIVGGHLGYIFMYKPASLITDPFTIFKLNEGLSSAGGILTSLALIYFYCRYRSIKLSAYLTPIVFSFPIGWFIARLGCTINHEHPGTATDFFLGRYCRPVEGANWEWPRFFNVPFGDLRFASCLDSNNPVLSYSQSVDLNEFNGIVGVHDMGLYEALYALVISIIFYCFFRKRHDLNFYLYILCFTYLPLRFAMDFLRPLADNPRYFELTPAQWVCLLGSFCLAFHFKFYNSNIGKLKCS